MIEGKMLVKEKTDSRIIFGSLDDMVQFLEDVSNGKWVVLSIEKNGMKYSELVDPKIFSEITNGTLKITSEEKV
jgi:hypothetical protein